MAGSGVDRSWAASSTSTRRQLETAGQAPWPHSGTRQVQGDRVEVKHVAGQDAVGLRPKELRPGRSAASGRGLDPRRAQDLPDGGGVDPVAKASELAMDAPIAPGGVLAGQAHDQSTNTGGNGGAPRSHRRGSPAAGDELAVPACDRRGCDQQSASATGTGRCQRADRRMLCPAARSGRRPLHAGRSKYLAGLARDGDGEGWPAERCCSGKVTWFSAPTGGELAVAVADQKREASVGVVEVHEQVAGLLGQPGSGRVRGDAQDVHAAGGVFDDEERVEPVQGDRVEVEQVAGQDRRGPARGGTAPRSDRPAAARDRCPPR